MKRLVFTFLSTAAVCAVLSAAPAAAQDTVTGAPAGEAPVTVEGYGNASGYTGESASNTGRSTRSSRPNGATLLETSMASREGTRASVVPDLLAGCPTRARPCAERSRRRAVGQPMGGGVCG